MEARERTLEALEVERSALRAEPLAAAPEFVPELEEIARAAAAMAIEEAPKPSSPVPSREALPQQMQEAPLATRTATLPTAIDGMSVSPEFLYFSSLDPMLRTDLVYCKQARNLELFKTDGVQHFFIIYAESIH